MIDNVFFLVVYKFKFLNSWIYYYKPISSQSSFMQHWSFLPLLLSISQSHWLFCSRDFSAWFRWPIVRFNTDTRLTLPMLTCFRLHPGSIFAGLLWTGRLIRKLPRIIRFRSLRGRALEPEFESQRICSPTFSH